MTHLQKKCLVGAACTHLLLLVVVLAASAFHAEPELTGEQVLSIIPTTILDRAGSGGGPLAPVTPQPARTQSIPTSVELPSPTSEAHSQPRQTIPQHPSHETAVTVTETPAKPSSKKKAAPDKPARRSTASGHVIPDFSTRVSLSGRNAPKNSESTNSATSESNGPVSRMADIRREIDNLNRIVATTGAPKTVVTMPGESDGDAFIGYNNFIFQAYYRAWRTPDTAAGKVAVAEVEIVVERDGTIKSAEIIRKSGDSALDRSVQRALDQVKDLPPFPKEAKDEQRSFKIRFNLEEKQSSG
jgi:TonB family protein